MTSPVWHPFTQHGLGEPIPTVVRTEGAALHTADGARIVDAISSWWVTTHGHRHPAIMAAIAEATESLDQIIRSEEHPSELQSLMRISSAVYCLKKNTLIC